ERGSGGGRDGRLPAERERELLSLRRLDEKRRLELRGANRLFVPREHRRGRGYAGSRALFGETLLATQAQDDLRVVRQRDVGELAGRGPGPPGQRDVLAPLPGRD